jgi:Predicted transcriptional regulator
MNFSVKTRYGLRILLHLAQSPDEKLVSTRQLARD